MIDTRVFGDTAASRIELDGGAECLVQWCLVGKGWWIHVVKEPWGLDLQPRLMVRAHLFPPFEDPEPLGKGD